MQNRLNKHKISTNEYIWVASPPHIVYRMVIALGSPPIRLERKGKQSKGKERKAKKRKGKGKKQK